MRKIFLFLAIAIGLVLVGCTSSKVDPASAESDIAADIAGEEGADFDGEEIADTEEEFGDDFGSDATAADDGAAGTESIEDGISELDNLDGAPQDNLADQSTNSLSLEDEAGSSAGSTGDDPGLGGDASTDLSADAGSDSLFTDSSTTFDETQGLSGTAAYVDDSAAKPLMPLQKMVTTPYTKGGVTVNALYIARKGDNWSNVSQKIYGQDKTEELKSVNASFSYRDLKVGDKVYYNSPQRPTDTSTMQTYYEDMGLAPEIYLSQPGDNIRTVAKNILGHENSWKELWTTNLEVESKGELLEGTRLKYWSGDGATSMPAAPIASTMAPPVTEPVQESFSNEPPPPMPDDVVAMEQDVPPPPPISETDMMAEATPPPPAPVEMVPPPVANVQTEESALGDDPDQMMALGAGAILLIASIAMFIIIRKKRARRSNIDFQTATHTNIE